MKAVRTDSWRAAGSVGYVFGALGAQAVPGPVLVSLLADLGVREDAARAVLSRMTRAGQVRARRYGRVAVYELVGVYRDQFLRFRDSFARGRGEAVPAWSGAYDAVLYDIAERDRTRRDELRSTAFDHGFGSPRPGLLIGFGDPEEWLRPFRGPADPASTSSEQVETFRLRCDLATARRLSARAWPLTELTALVDAALDQFGGLAERAATAAASRADDDLTAFGLHHTATNQLVGTDLVLPRLPVEIAPAGWRAAEIHPAYAAVAGRTWQGARRHVLAALERSPHQTLVTPWEP